jgi:surface protein
MNLPAWLFILGVSLLAMNSCSTENTPVYTLTTNVSPVEAGSVSPNQGEYDKGTEVQVSASANEHWVFTGWGGDYSGSTNPATIMMDDDKSLSALFEKKEYALTVNIEGEGTVEERLVNAKSTDYPAESVVELTAVPAENWEFTGWEGGLNGDVNPETVTILSETSLTAVFEEIIEVNVEGNGTVEIEFLDGNEKRKGTTRRARLTAVPDEEHYFAQWGGDIEGIENPTIVEFDENMKVDASFVDRPFFLDANGVTVRCHDAAVGEKGSIDGVEYEAVDRELLIQRRDEGADLSKVCTSAVTDMSELFYNPADNASLVSQSVNTISGKQTNLNREISQNSAITDKFLRSFTRLSQAHSLSSGSYYSSNSINSDIGSWDVSNVTNMFLMFFGVSDFNQDLTHWDVGNVTNMGGMFLGTAFNQPIGNWNVSHVVNMNGMFGASEFNQPIEDWNVGNVMDMAFMFYASPFNQSIGSWDVSSVTTMGWMFFFSSFDQPIGNWDVSNVTDMMGMFFDSPFNQPIGNWDVSNVTTMSSMFFEGVDGDVKFNQPIGDWDVSNVTDMGGMFAKSVFNQPIEDWDVSNVKNMSGMFRHSEFNQPIGDWDVSSVDNMVRMFFDATNFNQNLTGWCVQNIPDEPEEFASGSPLSEENKPIWGTCP